MKIWRTQLFVIALSALPVLYLTGLRLALSVSFDWFDLIILWGFVVAILFIVWVIQPIALDGTRWLLPWGGVLLVFGMVLAWVWYTLSADTRAAWLALLTFFAVSLILDAILTTNRSIGWRGGVRLTLGLAVGFIPVIATQIESSFAEEEFFIALQGFALACFWFVLLVVWRLSRHVMPIHTRRGIRVNSVWLGVSLLVTGFVVLVLTVRLYQQSFYPSQAPMYPDISTASPFLCGRIAPDAQTFDGEEVFHRLLARVAANPYKRAPEYGMLALGTREIRWANAFRQALLREAAQARFTEPANSVKSRQYEAALRVYYYPRVRLAFPDLFTTDEERVLRQWFADINRRALTVEWVDWLYALAFSKLPEGPYENQESGAGLLALLESYGLSAPDLSPKNRDYLERNRRGWTIRFRNTDDAFIYQPEWITNAFFQSLYTGQRQPENMRLAFEWMLLQALPDGSPLRYNHPSGASLAGIAYLGAYLLGDARYIWLSGKAVSRLEAQGGYLFAQPGVEEPVALRGQSPTEGTCLLYGDSGLPNQVGPLAPDKIVFRNGWADDSAYLLLNLRFTGWHRYKATNTLTLMYKRVPIVTEKLDGDSFSWLPVGRSLFRDKRIPRENLNGVLVERTGMNAVLHHLTGVGGLWAEDPPYYARVAQFKVDSDVISSITVLEGWRGWQHWRTVYWYPDGLVVIVDDMHGSTSGKTALVWNVPYMAERDGRLFMRDSKMPVEMVLMPLTGEKIQVDKSRLYVVSNSSERGRLRVVTLFLFEKWVGAKVTLCDWEQCLVQVSGKDNSTETRLISLGERCR